MLSKSKSLKPKTPNAEKMVRRLSRMVRQAEERKADGLTTEWEESFLTDVRQCVQQYGRAFGDPEKGNLSEPVSIKQSFKIREIGRLMKLREKGKTPRFGRA